MLTHLNAPRLPGAKVVTDQLKRILQVLQDDEILDAGQPVAVVVADDLERAQYAGSLVELRYEPKSPVAEIDSAIEDAYAPKERGTFGGGRRDKCGDVDTWQFLGRAKLKVEAARRN